MIGGHGGTQLRQTLHCQIVLFMGVKLECINNGLRHRKRRLAQP